MRTVDRKTIAIASPEVQRDAVRLLTDRGYRLVVADSSSRAWDYLSAHTPEVLVLGLPDSRELCRRFREHCDNPVILLLEEDNGESRIAGLNQGADYFLARGFCPEELLAAVNHLLKRREKTVLRKGGLAVDRLRGLVTVNGENIHLTAKEFGLLLILMQNEGKEVSVEELYEAVWDSTPGRDMRTVRKHIMNLRAKIRAGETDDYDILTAYGKGYIFQ